MYNGGFEHGPGIYQVGTEAQCRAAIEEILQKEKEGRKITSTAVRRYFKAFADTGICIYSPIEGADPALVEQSRKEIVVLAVTEIKKAVLTERKEPEGTQPA